MVAEPTQPLGTELPEGTRFIGGISGSVSSWEPGIESPSRAELDSCVACGLCLPHCPTYRLTGEEPASPRGRIAAMRAVGDGVAKVDDTFARFMDLCLVCRACEDVCPSHVPFGRMMEAARAQVEPIRSRKARALRWLGLDVVLPHPSLVRSAALFQSVVRPLLPDRVRSLVPKGSAPFRHLPKHTPVPQGVPSRGEVALLSGCVQDRWFHHVNLATIRVLSRNGWTVTVPRGQRCCGALSAHNGRLNTARKLAVHNSRTFAGATPVIANAAGCSAHMKSIGAAEAPASPPVFDLMEFLHDRGLNRKPGALGPIKVAYHDACHALRAQHISQQPRELLRSIPGVELVEIVDGDRCCGAAGLYNVTEPEMASRLRDQKAEAIVATGARVVASANPGCSMQIVAGLRALGHDKDIEVLHPVELLDRAYGL